MSENEKVNHSEMQGIIGRSMSHYGGSPAKLQRDVLEAVRLILGNQYGIIDPSNPVALVLEASSTQTANAINKYWTLNRRQYPKSAQSYSDLLPHFSDKDWIGAFSLPSKAKFVIVFQYEEMLRMVRPLDDGSDTKLLRIPRGMRVTVGTVDFLLDYPINIVQLKHGGFRVSYDTTELSPIQELSSNLVNHVISTVGSGEIDGVKNFAIEIEMVQVTETVFEESINFSGTIHHRKSFPDDYFFSRVYTGNDVDGWNELETTHSPDIYDATKPTAVLTMTENIDDNTLDVTIPIVYSSPIVNNRTGATTNKLGSRIRVEIYSTLGHLNMNLDGYTPAQFTWDFFPAGERKRDYSDLGAYSAALQSVQSVLVFSESFISQGRNKLSFEELRQRVIDNTTGPNIVPVSNKAIEDKMADNGFTISKSVDYITSRAYWAVREIPNPSNEELITPASTSIETFNTTMGNLLGTGTVIDNGKRVTITPETIYQMNNGQLSVLTKREVDDIRKMTPENIASRVNRQELFYSPFHYVLDSNRNTVNLRPYYLDSPRVRSKSSVDANNGMELALTISEYAIEKTEEGYNLNVVMRSNEAYKEYLDDEIWAQLMFHPHNDKGYIYIPGQLIGRTNEKEPIFQFKLDTRFDIDENHCLIITNGTLHNATSVKAAMDLETDCTLIFGFYGDRKDWKRVALDSLYNINLVNINAKTIVAEKIKVHFGYHLEYLWTRARTHASDLKYRVHDEDVPMVYKENIFELDENGNRMSIVNGKPVYKLKHAKGDYVRDKQGELVYRHRKGDIYLDENGQKVIDKPRDIIRRLELMLVDGIYWFATDEISQEYRKELVATLIDWLVDDLGPLNERTLEQTKIYFYPSSTMGDLKVLYNDGQERYINAAQSLVIDLTVNRQIYLDYEIQEKIKEATIRIIKDELTKETVSISSIVARLVKEHGQDVIGVRVGNLGNDDNIISFTVVDKGKSPGIRKRLSVNSDGTLSVRENIAFNFILHESREK